LTLGKDKRIAGLNQILSRKELHLDRLRRRHQNLQRRISISDAMKAAEALGFLSQRPTPDRAGVLPDCMKPWSFFMLPAGCFPDTSSSLEKAGLGRSALGFGELIAGHSQLVFSS